MAISTVGTDQEALEAFDAEIQRSSLQGHWKMALPNNVEPHSKLQPMHWRWSLIREYLLRAGSLISVGDAGRRTIQLINPGMAPKRGTTHTLQMSFQLVLPGELATAHRHSMNAIRFVVEGGGTYTTVNGDSFLMEPGDLILTPGWTWHDHINESEEPIIWIDALDVPLVFALDTTFVEDYEAPRQAPNRIVRTEDDVSGAADQSTWYFKARPTEERLRRLAKATNADADVVLEYRHADGRATLPTMLCGRHLLRGGEVTAMRRRTPIGVYHAVRGRGTAVIGDETFAWEQGDAFVVPNWAWYRLENRSADEEAQLFFISDKPVMEALGFFREERQPTRG